MDLHKITILETILKQITTSLLLVRAKGINLINSIPLLDQEEQWKITLLITVTKVTVEETNLVTKVAMAMAKGAMTLTITSHLQAEETNHLTLIMVELLVALETTIPMRSLNTNLKRGMHLEDLLTTVITATLINKQRILTTKETISNINKVITPEIEVATSNNKEEAVATKATANLLIPSKTRSTLRYCPPSRTRVAILVQKHSPPKHLK
jgi:hypothetical protein